MAELMTLLALLMFTFVVLIAAPFGAFAWVVAGGLKQGWRARVAVLAVVLLIAFAFHSWANRSGLYYVLVDANAVAADGMPEEPFFSFP